MNNKEIIKKLEKKGFIKYKPNNFQSCDIYFQKKINNDCYIGVSFYSFNPPIPSRVGVEIEVYKDLEDCASNTKLYAFSDFDKALKRAEKLI